MIDLRSMQWYHLTMKSLAERNFGGWASKVQQRMDIGAYYSVPDIEKILEYNPGGAKNKGILVKSGGDMMVLLITLKKGNGVTPYADGMHGNILFWEGQLNSKNYDKYVLDDDHDIFICVRRDKSTPFYQYLGRAIPMRYHLYPSGIPSKFVFKLYEYSVEQKISVFNLLNPSYDASFDNDFREVIAKYRSDSLEIWKNKCVLSNIDESSLLLSSHIIPWKDSFKHEWLDPYNSVILTPNYEQLFSRGIISFSENTGDIMFASDISNEMKNWIDMNGISSNTKLTDIPNRTQRYFEYRNKYIFNYTDCNDLNDGLFKTGDVILDGVRL